jgi:hypothetical protein
MGASLFADYFFDNNLVDFLIHSRMKESYDEVVNLKHRYKMLCVS